MKIPNFLRRSLPLLCAALLLASLAVPASAASAVEDLQQRTAELTGLMSQCFAANDRVKGTLEAFETQVSSLTERVNALDGVSAVVTFDVPESIGDTHYSVSSLSLVDALSQQIGDLTSANEQCRAQADECKTRLLNLRSVLVSLSSSVDVLDGGTSPTLPYCLYGSDNACPSPPAVESVINSLNYQITCLEIKHANCSSVCSKNAEYLSAFQSFYTDLETRVSALDGGSGSSVPVPVLSITGDTLTLECSDSTVTQFAIYVDGELKATINRDSVATQYNLAQLELAAGTYQITAAAYVGASTHSEISAAVSYEISASAAPVVPVPVLSITGDTLTLECSDSTVTQFAIYVDGELKTTINRDSVATQYNLAQLELAAGTYQITAAAYAGASTHSDPSAAVSYTASGKIFFTVGSLSFDVDVGTTWQDFVSSTSWPSNGVTLAIGSDNSITYSTDAAVYLVSGVQPADQITAKTYEISLVNELTTFVVSIDGSSYKFTCDTGSQWAEWIRDTTFPVNGCTFALDGDLVRVTKDGKTLLVSGVTGNDVIDAKTYTALVKFAAPVISISGDRLSISYSGDDSVTTFAIYVDGELSATVSRTGSLTDFSLSDLGHSSGTYTITVAGGKAQTILTDVSNSLSYVCSSELTLPSMEISGSILSLSCSNPFVTQYRIYIDDELKVTIPKSGLVTQYDLRQLGLPDGKKYWVTVSSGNSDDEFSILSGEADVFVVWNLSGDTVYVFTGTVYDENGSVNYGGYGFSGEFPACLTLIVSDDGFSVHYGDLSTEWPAISRFLGVRDSNGVFYGPGTYTLFADGSSHSLRLDFFVLFRAADPVYGNYSSFSGFAYFLVTVLGAFLSFSILPGVTFGGLICVFVVIGIVKFFLKD